MKSSHLDHYPKQFDQIVHEWCSENNLVLEDIKLEDSKDNSCVNILADKDLEKNFFDYHLRVAEYRVVLNKVNLQRGKWKKEDVV